MSTALGYLGDAERGRPNLVIRSQAVVDRLQVREGRATGVVLAGGETVDAGEVVLAAGAYATPALLLRSGIGPAAELSEHGIATVQDLPGVGSGLLDHALLGVDYPYAGPASTGHKYQVMLSLRSSEARTAAPDLHIFAAGPFESPDSPTGAVFALVVGLIKPVSRGWVKLRAAGCVGSRHCGS